jgi:hypothetical protein
LFVTFEAPGMTIEQYDRVMEVLEMRTDDDMPDGAASHVAGSTGDGILAVDVWESEEALGGFVETRLKSALREAGVDPDSLDVRVVPVHNRLRGRAGQPAA